jgi:hypothetical protein
MQISARIVNILIFGAAEPENPSHIDMLLALPSLGVYD